MFKHILIFLKGMAMGAADVVPGVSGGTIAFITGIYDDLLASINAVSLKTFTLLRKEGFDAAWKAINGTFLVALLLGIAISFIMLAQVFKYLLDTYPHLLWAFFFGLIIGSIFLVKKMVQNWDVMTIIGLIIGTAISYWFTILEPVNANISYLFVFFAGAIAICAMILPGISGSFILLLMGMYYPMLEAVKNMDMKFIMTLGSGAIVGLLSFSRLLKWTLDNFKEVTISVLLGFLVGSLNKIWPWKKVLSTRVNSHGEEVPFIQKNILPTAYENPQISLVLVLVITGIAVIILLGKFTPAPSNKE